MARLGQDSLLGLKARTEEFYSGTIVAENGHVREWPPGSTSEHMAIFCGAFTNKYIDGQRSVLKIMLAKNSRSPS